MGPVIREGFDMSDDVGLGDGQKYWFNIRTGKVETEYDKSQGKDLMGPYGSEAEAAQALQTAATKTEEWDEQERRWREGDDAD